MALALQKGKEMLYLTREQVLSLGLSMDQCIDIMEQVYIEKGKGNTILPAKHPMNPYKGLRTDVTAMPACNMGMGDAGVKVIAGFGSNLERGLPFIHALYVLMDIECGVPLAVMDATWITAIRTGAVTGLVCRMLANPDSEVATIIGTGLQGRVSLEAFMCTMKKLKKVYVTDKIKSVEEKYLADMRAKYPNLEIVSLTDLESACKESDILLCCVPSDTTQAPVIEKTWFKQGALVLPIDGAVYFKPDAISESLFANTYTDDMGQHKHFQEEKGYYTYGAKNPHEIADVLLGKAPGRNNPEETILALIMGNGLVDLGAAQAYYKLAVEQEVGTVLPL